MFPCSKIFSISNVVRVENVPPVSSNAINVIDKELQSILKPLNLMQNLFLSAKYSVRDNIIASNSQLYNIISVFCITIFWCIYLHHLVSAIILSINRWGVYKWLYCFTNSIDFFIYLIGGLMNSFMNIIYSYCNILMVTKIQLVFRDLQVNADKLKSFIVCNWAFVIILNITWFGYIVSLLYIFPRIGIIDVIALCSCIAFDTNILYALLVLKLIEEMLRVWIIRIQVSSNNEEPGREAYWKLTFNVYLNILQIYESIETTFRQLIAFYTIYTAYLSLRNVATLLTLRNFPNFFYILFITQIWNMKNVVIVIFLSVQCERFYAAMRDVQSTCVILMHSRNCSDPGKRVFKNIQRVQKASFKKMSACGLFIIDAQLPLELTAFITSYTVVLLQFVYL